MDLRQDYHRHRKFTLILQAPFPGAANCRFDFGTTCKESAGPLKIDWDTSPVSNDRTGLDITDTNATISVLAVAHQMG